MPDISHWWGSDLTRSSKNDLATVDGLDRPRQRIVRRLCTPAGDDMFNKAYGAGLPKRIGDTYDVNKILSLIRSQILQEKAVAPDPPPQITVQGNDGYLWVSIRYIDRETGKQVTLTFEVTP